MDTKHKVYDEITMAKGIGILCVILGHSFKQVGATDVFSTWALSIIYSFHMPLFFFLSGFVSQRILKFSNMVQSLLYIKNKAIRMLIPYVVMSLMYIPLKLYLSQYAIKPYGIKDIPRILIGDSPNTAMWFLYFLFVFSAVAALIVRENNLMLMTGISLAMLIFQLATGWGGRLFGNGFYFLFGLLVREHYESVLAKINVRILLLASGLIFVGANLLKMTAEMPIIGLFTALSGIVFCLCFAVLCKQENNAVKQMLLKLGDYSMDLYVISDPVQTVFKLGCFTKLKMTAPIVVLICFVTGTVVSYLASVWIVRRSRILKLLFLGIKS